MRMFRWCCRWCCDIAKHLERKIESMRCRHKRHRKKWFHLTDINSTYTPLANCWFEVDGFLLFYNTLNAETTHRAAIGCLTWYIYWYWCCFCWCCCCCCWWCCCYSLNEYYCYYQHHKYGTVITDQKLIFLHFLHKLFLSPILFDCNWISSNAAWISAWAYTRERT